MQQPDTTGSTRLYELLAWLELNKKRVITAAIVLLLAGVAVYIYSWTRDQTELQASDALLQLRTVAEPGDARSAAAAADFQKIVREFPSTRAAERASILAASDLYTDGKYPEAQAEFDRFLKNYQGSPLAPIAALGVAASLDAQDKVDAALAAYQDVAMKYPGDTVVGRARLGAAALYEAKNQPDQALRIYEELGKPASFGTAAMDALMRRQRLLERHPELGRTNAPAITTSTNQLPPTNRLDLTPPAGAPAGK